MRRKKDTPLQPTILALGSFTPSNPIPQGEIFKLTQGVFNLEGEIQDWYHAIHEKSAIDYRCSVFGSDFQKAKLLSDGTMGHRNNWYKEHAPKLSLESAKRALCAWGGTVDEITDVIFVSCTGVLAPGVEAILVEKLGLKATTNRLGINMMGCFGAFKGLNVAHALSYNHPERRILLVCTELCSLHIQPSLRKEELLGNVLFADGSASCIIGTKQRSYEKPLWGIVDFTSYLIPDTQEEMTWEAGDKALSMKLTINVPLEVKRAIGKVVDQLIPKRDCDYAIHPGGKSILEGIQKALSITYEETKASWEILREFGNMSSATFLFVLERLKKFPLKNPYTLGLGFGPGLSIEGVLLKRL